LSQFRAPLLSCFSWFLFFVFHLRSSALLSIRILPFGEDFPSKWSPVRMLLGVESPWSPWFDSSFLRSLRSSAAGIYLRSSAPSTGGSSFGCGFGRAMSF
jgi:hypothetical protein